jgi:hypothetical protein
MSNKFKMEAQVQPILPCRWSGASTAGEPCRCIALALMPDSGFEVDLEIP